MPLVEAERLHGFAKHELGRDAGHLDAADLGDERDRAAGARVRLDDVHLAVLDRELHVHEAHDLELRGNPARVVENRRLSVLGNRDRGEHAGRVAGVDARELDMLHDRRNEDVIAVGKRIGLALHRVAEEAVEVERTVGRDANRLVDVFTEHDLVEDDLHAAAAENERRTDDERIAELRRALERAVDVARHHRLGHRDAELVHRRMEEIAVFRVVDRVDGSAEDLAAGLLELARDVERRLPAELDDDAHGLLGLVDLEYVFDRNRLEVELVGSVVVGRDRLGVAVDDDRLVAHLPHRHRCVAAAVVELDALADAVRTAAENHHLLRVVRDRRLAKRLRALRVFARLDVVVGRVVVRLVLDTRNRHGEPALAAADPVALRADVLLGNAEDLREILVGKAVLLRLHEQVVGKQLALVAEDLLLFLDELAHLVDEVRLDAGALEDLLVGRSLPDCLVHLEVALGVGNGEKLQELVERLLVEVLRKAKPSAPALKRADRLLESLLVGLADGHDLADGLHLRAELVLDGAELLERPAGELEDDVVAVRRVLLEAAVAPVGNLVHRHARGELRRDERNREAGRLRGERRRARGAGVDLDDDDAARLRVVCELDVRAADDADGLDDLECVATEALFELLVDREEGSRAVAVASMDADGVDVLDEADGDHLVLRVAHDFDLELLPVEDRLFDEALVGE